MEGSGKLVGLLWRVEANQIVSFEGFPMEFKLTATFETTSNLYGFSPNHLKGTLRPRYGKLKKNRGFWTSGAQKHFIVL